MQKHLLLSIPFLFLIPHLYAAQNKAAQSKTETHSSAVAATVSIDTKAVFKKVIPWLAQQVETYMQNRIANAPTLEQREFNALANVPTHRYTLALSNQLLYNVQQKMERPHSPDSVAQLEKMQKTIDALKKTAAAAAPTNTSAAASSSAATSCTSS